MDGHGLGMNLFACCAAIHFENVDFWGPVVSSCKPPRWPCCRSGWVFTADGEETVGEVFGMKSICQSNAVRYQDGGFEVGILRLGLSGDGCGLIDVGLGRCYNLTLCVYPAGFDQVGKNCVCLNLSAFHSCLFTWRLIFNYDRRGNWLVQEVETAIAHKNLGITVELVNVVGVKPAPRLSFRPNIRIPNIEGIVEHGFVVTDFFR